MTLNTVPAWRAEALRREQALRAAIPAKWTLPKDHSRAVSTAIEDSGHLTPKELRITKLDATAIRDAIAKRELSSVEVTMAFAQAAALAHSVTNCLMHWNLEEALERAKWLDEELERTGSPVGPLHGVPISVKGHVGLKGTPSYVGFLAETEETSDAVLVDILRKAGAVFIVKTTVPQAVLHLECDSYQGPTLNSHNTSLTSGGSSGGEGALIGSNASCLGIGSDIGGSIRVPAAHNGIFGFKPTVGRLPRGGGGKSIYAGQDCIIGTTGPMGRSARDMNLFMKVILDAEPWRRSAVCMRMPWDTNQVSFRGQGGLPRVGVLWDDGAVQPLPPMRRAMTHAVEKLRTQGFELVDLKPYAMADSWSKLSQLYMSDGGGKLRALAEATGEPLLPLTEWLMDQMKELTADELMKLVLTRDSFRAEYLEYFESTGVDVILCPPFPGPAPKLGTSKYWTYTAFWNFLDYPAGTFPTGLVVEEGDTPETAGQFWSDADREVWAGYDSPESFLRAPLSLQVAGPRWEDEKVTMAMEIISNAVRN